MSSNELHSASVHRFRQFVALACRNIASPRGGGTVYLTANEALALADALTACATDCQRREFINSEFRTRNIEPNATPPADNRCIYRTVRFRQDARPRPGRKLLTLTEAQAHCKDPKTRGLGWFDGYEVHPKFKGLA